MLSSFNATQVAFLQIAVLQAVAALVWALGAWRVRAERRALAHWAAYAALSATNWFSLSHKLQSPPLPVIIVGVLAAIALRRGMRLFMGRDIDWREAVACVALVAVVGLAAEAESWRSVQAAVNFGVLGWIYAGMALDLRRHARDDLRWRVPWLLALPPLVGAFAFAARGVRAALQPESVLAEMATHSALNVGSALVYIALVLALHATLIALVTGRLVSQLQRLARRDALTGALNRRAIHDLLDQQAAQRRRAGDALSLLMIDLDHFKSVNDRYGHEVGDRALVHVVRLLTQALGEHDCLGRLGGEEFVVLLPGADLSRAQALAERLRATVQGSPLAHGELTVPITLSIGAAQWAGPGEDVLRLLVRADDALYCAKRAGRNCVQVAPDDPTATRAEPA